VGGIRQQAIAKQLSGCGPSLPLESPVAHHSLPIREHVQSQSNGPAHPMSCQGHLAGPRCFSGTRLLSFLPLHCPPGWCSRWN